MEESKKTGKWAILAFAVVAAMLSFGIYKDIQAEGFQNDIEMDYQRCFTELVQYVDDLQTSLEKARFVNDPRQMMLLSGEIYRQASSASANLSLLPLKQKPLENISEFLAQVGNYSYSLSLKMLDGEEVSDKEYKNLSDLESYAEILAKSLDKDLESLYNGTLDITQAGDDAKDSQIDSVMGEIEEQMHDYPALIYDGPFSSHLTDREPLFLENSPEIGEKEAVEKAKSLIGEDKKFNVVLEKGNIPIYYITAEDDSGIYTVGITKKGGALIYYLRDRVAGEATTDMEGAKKKAAEFLIAAGFEGMKENYYEVISNVAVINYAPKQSGYTLYPDLVKVKVALDTGEIIGCESRGYIMYHRQREIPDILISEEEARGKVNPHVNIEGVSLALIPQESGTEAFCWEIEGSIEDRKCLIYINTATGNEEKILLLIESDTGVLTV